MKFLQYSQTAGCLALLMLVSMPVSANQCNELSELRVETGDAYFELPFDGVKKGSSTERETHSLAERYNPPAELNSLRKKRFRKGTGVRHVCKGTENNPVLESTEFEIKDYRVSDYLNGNVVLRVLEDSEDWVRPSTMEFPADSQWSRTNQTTVKNSRLLRQRINLNRPQFNPANFQLSEIPRVQTNDGFAASTSGRSFIPVPNYMAEIHTNVERINRGFRLTQSIYHNGHKVEWVVWDLKS